MNSNDSSSSFPENSSPLQDFAQNQDIPPSKTPRNPTARSLALTLEEQRASFAQSKSSSATSSGDTTLISGKKV